MLFEIKSPSPVPNSDFVANCENSLGIISGCIPVSVSFMLTIIITYKRGIYLRQSVKEAVRQKRLLLLLPMHKSTNSFKIILLELFYMVYLIMKNNISNKAYRRSVSKSNLDYN